LLGLTDGLSRLPISLFSVSSSSLKPATNLSRSSEHGTPERLAEAASTLIALANEHRALEFLDFTFPLSGVDVSDDFIALLRYGAALCALCEVGKLISLLNYELTKERATSPRVYRLRAPHPELEYALRLGFIRGDIRFTTNADAFVAVAAATEDHIQERPDERCGEDRHRTHGHRCSLA
jgi:hypothetical protein